MNKIYSEIIGSFKNKDLSEIFHGSIVTFFGRGLAVLSGFVFMSVVAKNFGAKITGNLALLITFLNFSNIFTLLGFNVSVLRFIPEFLVKYNYKTVYNLLKKIYGIIFITSLIFGLIFYLNAKPLASYVFQKPDFYKIIEVGAGLVIFKAFFQVSLEIFRAFKKINIYAFSQFIYWAGNIFVLLVLKLMIKQTDLPLYSFGIILIIFSMIFVYKIFSYVKSQMGSENAYSFSLVYILKISLPMFLTSSLMYLLGQIDIFMLGIYTTAADTGIYYVAVRLALVTSFILGAINAIAAPKFSELFQDGKINELLLVAKNTTKIIFYLTLPILLILVVGGKFILGTFFGSDFISAYPSLIILVISQFINAISGSVGYFMNMTGGEKIFRNIMIITVLINIILNYILIPIFGIEGAAIASAFSTVFWNTYLVIWIKIKYGKTISYFPLVG